MQRSRQHWQLASRGKGTPWRFGVAVLGMCLSLPRPAAAEEESTAERLFREGRQLLSSGQLAEACDKFAESQEAEASSGALLNLARCHADAGMSATAWAEYLAAARLARAQERPQQATEAELRAAELQPRLIRLRLDLDPQPAGVVVTRNGEPLAPSELNVPLVVDPGSHVIRAVAPGHTEWTTTVILAQPGQLRRVIIPALAPLASAKHVAPARPPPEPLTKPPAPPPAEPHDISARTWIASGVGVVALVSSATLAWVAKSKWDEAHDKGLCDARHACNQAGLTQTDQARRLGNLATAFAVAGVAAGTCAVLFYASDVAKRNARVQVQARVAFDPRSVVLGVEAGF